MICWSDKLCVVPRAMGLECSSLTSRGRVAVLNSAAGKLTEARTAMEKPMTEPEIGNAAPFFIVTDVPKALAFYRDQFGFEITYQGPEPDDIFFGIVKRGHAMIMMKEVGVEPMPNHARDIGKGIARWDAYIYVPDPDALAAEFESRNVEFTVPLQDNEDGLRGFEVKDADGYNLYFGRPCS